MATLCFRQLLRKRKRLLFIYFLLAILVYFYCYQKIQDEPERDTNQVDSYNTEVGTFSLQFQRDDWQDVAGLFIGLPYSALPIKFRVYSAFAFQNSKFEGQLIVIGSHTYPTLPLQCIFPSKPSKEPLFTQATADFIPHWDPRHSAVFIKCPFPPQFNILSPGDKPPFVSITSPKSPPDSIIPSNRLRINYQPYQGATSSNFRFNVSVCVLPTYGSYNQVLHFLEWFEYYKMMGAQHFTFYNMSVGPSISCIWNHLSTSGQISVNPWHNFPLIPNPRLLEFSFGYSAAMTDCQFRYTGISKYVVVVDFDEFITPVLSNLTSFRNLINYLDATRPGEKLGQYVIPNGFFMAELQQDPLVGERCAHLLHRPSHGSLSLEYQVCQHLLMMKYIQREPIVKGRTKYIMMPERVQVAGNHYVHVMENPASYSTYHVPETVAYHRHFRGIRGIKGISNMTSEKRLDIKVGMRLARRVAKQVQYFKETCGLQGEEIFDS